MGTVATPFEPADAVFTTVGGDAGTPGRRRELVAVNAGNALEWFDWNIYAIFTPFLAV